MDSSDTVIIRRSKNEDENPFSDLIDSQGGKSLFRAIFGQFNFNNMIGSLQIFKNERKKNTNLGIDWQPA